MKEICSSLIYKVRTCLLKFYFFIFLFLWVQMPVKFKQLSSVFFSFLGSVSVSTPQVSDYKRGLVIMWITFSIAIFLSDFIFEKMQPNKTKYLNSIQKSLLSDIFEMFVIRIYAFTYQFKKGNQHIFVFQLFKGFFQVFIIFLLICLNKFFSEESIYFL